MREIAIKMLYVQSFGMMDRYLAGEKKKKKLISFTLSGRKNRHFVQLTWFYALLYSTRKKYKCVIIK